MAQEGYRPSGRVVVTGLGAVTPVGLDVESTWASIVAGRSGVGPITSMDTSDYPTSIAAEVKGFDAADWLDGKTARRIDLVISFTIAAAKMSLDDARFPLDDADLCLQTGEIGRAHV